MQDALQYEELHHVAFLNSCTLHLLCIYDLLYLFQDKNGCSDIQSCLDLVVHVKRNCENLEFVGLMTIGRVLTLPSDEPNPDFEVCTILFP